MAKVKMPLLSGSAHGKIGEGLTFSKRKSGQQVRWQRNGIDRQTAGQLAQRATYQAGCTAWGTLSSGEKAVFNNRAVGRSYTGFNLFMKEYLLNPTILFFGGYSDNFNDNSIGAFWKTTGEENGVFEQNNRIEITHPASGAYSALVSNEKYNFTNRVCSIKLVDVGNQSLTEHEVCFRLRADESNGFFYSISSNAVNMFKITTAGGQEYLDSYSYSAENVVYLRFRSAGGNIYYEHSANGTDWTTDLTIANPVEITSLEATFETGAWAEVASGSYAYFDDFNIV